MTGGGDATRVRAAIDDGLLLHPNEGAANTVDLAMAMAWLAGAPIDAYSGGAQRVAEIVGRYEHYVFVLIDGLGMNLVEASPNDAFLRSHVAMELRAVFPSSTAPALTSIATARWPAEHAVTGWWTYLPAAGVTATILPYIERFSETPLDRSMVPPSYAFPVESAAATFAHQFMMFTPKEIAGSIYSRYSAAEAPFRGYEKLADAVDDIAARVECATTPTYSYWYASTVDTAEHIYGPESHQVEQAINDVQVQVERLAVRLRGRARIVLTADHGQFTVGDACVLESSDPLVRLLRVPPSGDGRAPFFHLADGQHDAFAATFRERYAARFALLTVDQIEAMQLLGPAALTDETRRRAGHFVGIALGKDVLLYEPSAGLRALRGHHGGMTPDEMRIPLIVV